MQNLKIRNLSATPDLHEEAARILHDAFAALGNPTWPDLESALDELHDCLRDDFICLGALVDGQLAGWGGMRPMYGWTTCELHPLVVDPGQQGRGLGCRLLAALEDAAHERGARGVVLGTDDQTGSTTAAACRRPAEIADAITRGIQQLPGRPAHPAAFYSQAGYRTVGIIPDANGPAMPDILMWKALPG